MISLLASIDPQWFLLDVLIFSVALVVLGVLIYKIARPNLERTPYGFEKVSTEGFAIYDLYGAGMVVALFSLGVITPFFPPSENSQKSPEVLSEMAQCFLITVSWLVQFIIPSAALLFVLAFRLNIIKAFGLTNFNEGRAAFYIIIGSVLSILTLVLLNLFGFESLINSIFDKAPEQAAVKMFKEAKSPLILGLMGIGAIIMAPIFEEIIFRGFLYTSTKKHTGPIFAMISSALLFAVVHNAAQNLLPLFCIGVILALVYELSGSLWTCIAVHAIFNLVNVIMMTPS